MKSDLVTFKSSCGIVQFTVKKEFIDHCSNYLGESLYNLSTRYKISDFLHNNVGPAIHYFHNGSGFYFLNGRQVTQQEIYTIRFHGKIDDILSED